MRYKHRNRHRHNRTAFAVLRLNRYSPHVLIGLAGLILLSSIANPALWQKPRANVTDVLSPVISAVSQPFRFIADTIGGMTGISQLRADNDRLRAENQRLQQWYQTALLLRAENQSLKDLLNVMPEPEQSYISTRVIGDSGSSYMKSLLLQAGTDDGIKDGQAVLGPQGMIGRIIETGHKASRLLLLTDISSRVPVIIEGTNQRAILAGTNDDQLVLDHLPEDTMIEAGARVVTSGQGGLFPQGLPVGRTVKNGHGEISVELFSNPANTDYVQIVQRQEDVNVRQSLQILTTPVETAPVQTGPVREPVE